MDGNFPANLQDLSALLALVGGDSVEQKLRSQSSHDWERMSSVWSSFGMIGALRFYLKLAAGLAKSERSGVDLGSAALYTSHRTDSSLCYWGVNRANSPVTWRNSKDELLSLMCTSSFSSESTWLQPIFIAVGYSKCPWNWRSERGMKEIIIPTFWGAVSLAITTIPTLMLFPSLQDLTTTEIATVCLQASVGVFAGIILPLLIDRLNTPGVEHLAKLYRDRLMARPIPLLRDGDLVMADSTKKEARIVWQTPNIEVQSRSGDIWWIRALSVSSCLFIIGAFLGNYIALRNATQDRQCLWLGAQLAILAFRYLVWAERPLLTPQRQPCLLYLATGSLVDPISAIPPTTRVPASHPKKLALSVIDFAVAAAISRAHNLGSVPTRYRPELYARMADTVPSDLISIEFVNIAKYFNEKSGFSKMSVLRLSWAVVEEIYRAQGVILGPNPWAFGGLYLGAVFVENIFVGLTTVHPFSLHVQHCTDNLCAARHDDDYREGGFTRDGYFLSDLICGTVIKFACHSGDNVTEWHDMFRSNVVRCRSTARANGPSYTEIHAATSGVKPPADRMNVSRVEPTVNHDYIQSSAYYAMTKDHDDCRPELCVIYTFGGIEIRMPRSPKLA